MLRRYSFVLFSFILLFNFCIGLDYPKQQNHNVNLDFLAHEAGGTWTKRDQAINIQNNQQVPGNNNYESQFPALGPTSSVKVTTRPTVTKQQQLTGKRDYVAPQLTHKPSNTNNNQHMPSSTNQNPSTKSTTQTVTTKPQSLNGKRDYVAPQFSSPKPVQQNSGKVKDLINFYDQKVPQNVPSYSSILKNHGSTVTVHTPTTNHLQTVTKSSKFGPTMPTAKPQSFSSILSGNNKPSSPTTPRQSTPTIRPTSPGLPSTLLNRNKNSNTNNNNNQNNNANSPTDAELQVLSEELLRKDTNNAASYVTINYQEKTTSQSKEDRSPQPLLTVSSEAWNIPTIQTFVPLLDNYEKDTLVNEYVTPQERNEENAFMDAIMSTTVIRHLMNFLRDKGYVTPDPKQQRDFLKQLWFGMYSRGKGKISSSGFEHVFLAEIKNGDVIGLHNWIYFAKEELANRVNYLGYLKYFEISNKGVVMKLHFNLQGTDKPVNSLFVGTSPELEIALYTLCFVTRADNDCNLKLGSKDVNIVTHTFRYRSKNLIGSAYPQI